MDDRRVSVRWVWVAALVLSAAGACASHADAPKITTPPGRFGILSVTDKDGNSWVVVNEQQAAALLDVDLSKDPFSLHVPAGTKRGTVLSGSFSVCASENGHVEKVTVMRGMGTGSETIDKDWMETMKRWRYRPYTFRAVPTRFCTTARPRVAAP
jgi:hypothetical protein